MNEKDKELYSEVMFHIKSEILRRQGSGFTVELILDKPSNRWAFQSNQWYLTPPVKRALPKEIKINKSFSFATGYGECLTVPDNYAAKVYQEVYADIGIPFRDTLLTKHRELLKEIISSLFSIHSVERNTVKWIIGYNGIVQLHPEECVSFEAKGMQKLQTEGQLYGMALALAEIIKEYFDAFLSNHTIKISAGRLCYHNVDEIQIEFAYIKQEPKLTEW